MRWNKPQQTGSLISKAAFVEHTCHFREVAITFHSEREITVIYTSRGITQFCDGYFSELRHTTHAADKCDTALEMRCACVKRLRDIEMSTTRFLYNLWSRTA